MTILFFWFTPTTNPDPQLPIEEMARARMLQILTANPTGAFRLGGHCNGGLLAWEIARQLEQSGREVEFVALIDVPSLNARFVLRAIAKLIRFIVAVSPSEISIKFARDGMRSVWNKRKYMSWFGLYSRAIANYVPPKLATRVICMISEESRAKVEYSSRPWRNLTPEVTCIFVAGTHIGCVTENVGEVARALNGLLS